MFGAQAKKEPEKKEVQSAADGTGPLYHRIYRINLCASWEEMLEGMSDLQKCPDTCSPQWIAAFEKTKGSGQEMKVGDEFVVHLPSAWDAPVRVSSITPTSFRFETLEGHPESGAIEFRIREGVSGENIFEIESFARSHDALMDFIYDKVPVARLVQKIMWKKFCGEFAARVCKDSASPEVEVITEKKDSSGAWTRI